MARRLAASCVTLGLAAALTGVVPPGAAVAAPPAACATGAATNTYTQSTPTAVPAGPGVVTSTLAVSGAGAHLTDVNLLTHLVHTWAADLDVTLTSPEGTVVTLTTDNGGGRDDVFNGTVWDDDANPAGQVPHNTNQGVATDHSYTNLTTATPLAPEEPLGAFVGENPNGTWTITVSDDAGDDAGSLDSWALTVSSLPAAPPITVAPAATQSTPLTVPDDPAVVTSTLVVAGTGTYLADVDLTTALTHGVASEVDMTLRSPAGTIVTLTTDNGDDHGDVFNGTVWDDEANPAGQVPYEDNAGLVTDHAYTDPTPVVTLTPEEPLAAFNGENPNGTWMIAISDAVAGDGGTLTSWSLDIDAACPKQPPPPPPDTTVKGAKVKAKRQTVTATKFKVSTEVHAAAEALTASVTGKVKVKLANGTNATYQLAEAGKPAPLGGKAKLKQVLTGSKKKKSKARTAMIEALEAKRSVLVKLKYTITDAAGNTLVVKDTVKVKRG